MRPSALRLARSLAPKSVGTSDVLEELFVSMAKIMLTNEVYVKMITVELKKIIQLVLICRLRNQPGGYS